MANFDSVRTEEASKRLHPKALEKLERKRAKAETILEKIEAKEEGRDYEREMLTRFTAEEVEEWEQRRRKKESRKDAGFTDFHDMSLRKYKRQIRELKPDLVAYQESAGSSARDAHSLEYLQPGVATPEALNRLVADIAKQDEIRAKSSKQRTFKSDDDVTYINRRNEIFNAKIARAYDPYTKEIRDSLERGSAL